VHGDKSKMGFLPAISVLLLILVACPAVAFLHFQAFSRSCMASCIRQAKDPQEEEKFGSIFFEQETTYNVTRSQWDGAGSPRPELEPEAIPALLMDALRMNDLPKKNAGLRSVWEFAGDTTRHIFQHNLTDFIESAHETADTMATSFYGVAMSGKEWSMETSLNRVGGEDGWIATQVMKTISWDGRIRRWQWELRKHKRPPNLGAWYVESIGSSDRKGNFEADN
jgi:hypothetical protein